jgi:D-tyrosyl-tRNA(Tyr) deacylase
VAAEGRLTGEIGAGLMILLGVGREDTSAVAVTLAEKSANLRIFEDEQGKMNRSLLDVKGSALVVSQFTLYGDARGLAAAELHHCRAPGAGQSAL